VNRIEDWIDKAVSILMWLACFVGFLMMAHITLDVSGRVLFNNPLIGTIEVASSYYMVAVAYLPLAHVSRGDGQIIVELFTRHLTPGRILRIDAAINIITMIYMFIFAWYTSEVAIEMTHEGELGEFGAGYFAVWPSRWLLPLSFWIMTFYLTLRGVQDYRKAAEA
jgi:TRAP-type C4-dicarboxylate transport system permease small subunit